MSYFGTIYDDRDLSHRAKAVYMYLKDRSDVEGKCWPSLKTIAASLRLSVSTVQRALSELERAGYVTRNTRYRANGGKTSNLYTVAASKKESHPPRVDSALSLHNGSVHDDQ